MGVAKYEISAAHAAQLDRMFNYHAPNDDQPGRYREIRTKALSFAQLICACCPDSAERACAITRLNECVMWANAAIARNESPAVRR